MDENTRNVKKEINRRIPVTSVIPCNIFLYWSVNSSSDFQLFNLVKYLAGFQSSLFHVISSSRLLMGIF